LLLTNDDVEQVLTIEECVGVLRRFFEEEGRGQVLTRQRTESWLPHRTTDTFYQCKTMEGGVPYIGKYVIRVDSNVTRKKQQGQSSRVEHVHFGNGSWMGMLLVFSTETGELLGWMPDGYLQRTRVGALYALAADYLACPDAEEVGLIGSGWQAGGQILGLRCVRNIKKVRVYSSNANRRSRFAEELQASLGIEVRPVAAAREAFAESGYGVPLDDIADRAGVGPGTVYRHFPAKEALFEAVVTARIEDLAADARARAGASDPGEA